MTIDLLKHQYLVALANTIFSGDITFLNKEIQVLLLIDLGSRRVPAYKLSLKPFQTKDIIDLIDTIKKFSLIDGAMLFHFDQQSIFRSEELVQYAKKASVYLSNPEPHSHGNQVSERLNNTLKMRLRNKLATLLGGKVKPYLYKESLKKLVKRVSWDTLNMVFEEIIDEYNASPHSGKRMFNASPNLMNQALTNIPSNVVIPDQILAPNTNDKRALEIAQFKGIVLEKYSGKWEEFFIEWREEQKLQYGTILETNKHLLEQNELLKKQLDQLIASDQVRQERERLIQQKQELEDLKKEKRKNRKKKEPRAYISFEEFSSILQKVNGTFNNPNVAARIRIALTLLYFTGLRISNLLLLTKKDLYTLLNEGEITIRLIKGGKDRHLISLGAIGREQLRKIESDIDLLGNQQENDGDPFFFAPRNKKEPLNRFNFDKQCNQVLIWASQEFGKYIRSHSFRATFVTDLLKKEESLHKVKDIMGHKAINTTEKYRRGSLTEKELRRTVAAVNRARVQGWKVKPFNENEQDQCL